MLNHFHVKISSAIQNCLCLNVFLDDPHHLQYHRKQDQSQTDEEAAVEETVFLEEDKGHDDAVERFQVVTEVHCKSRNLLQRIHGKGVHQHSAEPGQCKQVEEVRLGWNDRFHRENMQVQRQQEREHQEADTEFIKSDVRRIVTHHQLFVEHGEQGCEHRRDDANDDTGAELGIEMKDQQDAAKREQAQQHFDAVERPPVDERVEECGK